MANKTCLKRFVLLALSVLLFVGCSNEEPDPDPGVVNNPRYPENNDRAAENVQFVKVAEYGLESDDDESIIGQWPQVAIGPENTVFVLDANPGRLRAYSADGTFLWARLQAGEGPGEISQPGNLVSDGRQYLYIHNQGGTRLDQFTMDGDLVFSIGMQDLGMSRPRLHGLLNDSTLAFSEFVRGFYGSETRMVRMGDAWRVASAFTIDFTDGMEVDDRLFSLLSAETLDGQLVAPDLDEFKFRIYNESGTVTKEIIRDLEGLSAPQMIEIPSGLLQARYSSLSAPFRLDEDWLIGQAKWTENEDELVAFSRQASRENRPAAITRSTLDFYDNDWNLIYSLNTDEQESLFQGTITASDGHGHVFIYSRTTGTVIKYRVEVDV